MNKIFGAKFFAKVFLICLVFSTLVVVLFNVPQKVDSAAQGDGIIVYGESTVTTPRTRAWTGSSGTWQYPETSLPAAAATIRHTVIKAAPTRDEMLAGFQTTGGALYIKRWNGATWSNEWNVTVGNGNLSRFDISYEQNSGEAVVIYGTNAATNELAYRVWNGSSWVGPTTYEAVRTTGIIHGLQTDARGGSDDIAVAWADANNDLSANYWDGATNSFVAEPSSVLSIDLARVGTNTVPTTWSFDLSFETLTGELLIVWGNNAVLDAHYMTRTAGVGGAWAGSAITNTSFFEEPTDMELTADQNSDYIAYANATDNGGDADAAIWNGSAWGPFSNFDTAIDTVGAGTSGIAINWVTSGAQTRAILTYDDANAVGVDWLFYNKNTNTWSALQADFTTAPAPSGVDDKMHRLRSNPFDRSQLLLFVIDSASDLFAKKLSFDGTNLTWSSTEPSSAALEITTSSITGFAADFAFNRYVAGRSLTLDAPASVTLNSIGIGGTAQVSSTSFPSAITVSDNTTTGWTATATCTNFTGPATILVTNLTFKPGTIIVNSGLGTGVSAGVNHTFSGTSDPATIMTATAGNGDGSYSVTPTLDLTVPAWQTTGSYSATITETVS